MRAQWQQLLFQLFCLQVSLCVFSPAFPAEIFLSVNGLEDVYYSSSGLRGAYVSSSLSVTGGKHSVTYAVGDGVVRVWLESGQRLRDGDKLSIVNWFDILRLRLVYHK